MIDRNRINILMARKVSGEATAAELEELEMLLARFPELQYAFTIVADINTVDVTNGFSEEEEQQLYRAGLARIDQLLEQEQTPVKRLVPWRMITGIAASIAILIAVGTIWLLPRTTTHFRNEVVTRNGSKTSMVLPDGTSVVLNACSRLQYDATRFLNGDREVSLSGEAYFDVKHDPSHPFIIRTGDVHIRVLGTVFNVKAYAEDATVETTLLSGKVEVTFPQSGAGVSDKTIQLQPEQKLIIDIKKDKPVHVNKQTNFIITPVKSLEAGTTATTAAAPPTAWVNDRFEFDNVTFEQLSHDLERWYNVKVIFKNDRYQQEVFTGAFKKQRIEDILQALQLMSGFHYEMSNRDNVIYIW